jgi:subtilisin family serine protease
MYSDGLLKCLQDAASVMRNDNLLEDAGVEVIKTYDSPLFTGAALKSTNGHEAIEALPGVARVWPNRLVFLDPETAGRDFSDDAASANYTQHISTRVSAMHAAGIFGKGVKIGVVDTGIDYNHYAVGRIPHDTLSQTSTLTVILNSLVVDSVKDSKSRAVMILLETKVS